MTRQKVSIDHRPSSNRRRHGCTAPPCRNCGASFLVSGPRRRAGDRFRMVRGDEGRDSDLPAPRHSSLPILREVHPSRRDAALKPVDLQGQPMQMREPLGAVRKEPRHLRKEPALLREAPTRQRERPTGLRTAATGPRPEETGLGRGASAARSPPWIAARSVH